MPSPVLTTSGLTYGYRRDRTLLDGLDLDLEPGALTALTGRSGTGKSTLLYLLAGLLTPWAGAVSYRDQELGALSDVARARLRAGHFGFVFQDFALDPRRTVLDSVLEPCLYAGLRKEELVGRATALLAQMGVETQALSRPGEVSGGQAQRVAVCRALLLEPSVVFADEPTGNLDHTSAEVVLTALEGAAAGGCTVLIATHDDRVVDRCPHRVVLS